MADTAHAGLGKLADPGAYRDPIVLDGTPPEKLHEYLRTMCLIRVTEECLGEMVQENLVKCPCHLGIGQEAIATGISAHLTAKDRVFGAHRSHTHYLSLGGDVFELIAEALGKEAGCSRGMGGSMHLYSGEVGFLGSVPIVGATIPIAVGAGLAAKMDGSDAVAVSYFGDGAAEEGVLHESLNFAANFKIPVLFVCENNLYSSHLDISQRQPADAVSRFAAAHLIPAELVDGNDVIQVAKMTAELLSIARKSGGPVFLEAVTYRWRGHVGPAEDIDVGLRRKSEDLSAWKQRDPIRRLADAMIKAGYIDEPGFGELQAEVRQVVHDARARALDAPYPNPSALLARVYSV